jgi:uncharacterized protein YkvS
MTVQTAIKAIRNVDTDDELKQIIDAVKLQRQFISVQNIRSVTVGNTVEFEARGRTVQGTVEKVNRKNVKVRETGTFTVWNVPASMLKQVEQTA